jgi:Flp pilus assembly protein TadG
MPFRRVHTSRAPRHGAAAVELALLLPVLMIVLVGAADFARVFRYAVIITNCARNGAIYGTSSPTAALDTAGIQTAALRDAGSLGPTVSSSTGTTTNGSDTYTYVNVTVTYNVSLYCSYLGIADPFALTRTIRMRVMPAS